MPEAVIPERITASSFLATQICSAEAEMKFWEWNQIKAEEVTSSQWKKSLDADPEHGAGDFGAAGRVARAGAE
jgi:hypothetical protein